MGELRSAPRRHAAPAVGSRRPTTPPGSPATPSEAMTRASHGPSAGDGPDDSPETARHRGPDGGRPTDGGGPTGGGTAGRAAAEAQHDQTPPGEAEHEETLGDRAAHALLEYRAGRTEAFGALVREATPLLWHTVRAQGVDRESADDVVQSTWVALVKHAGTIAEPHAVLKWLLVTAKRAAWENVRRAREDVRRRTELPDDSPDSPATLPDPDPTPDVEVLRDERDRLLWTALGRLPERCQKLLRLVSLADRPDYKAISHVTGMPVGSIGSTRGRCLAKLRDIIEEQGEISWTTT